MRSYLSNCSINYSYHNFEKFMIKIVSAIEIYQIFFNYSITNFDVKVDKLGYFSVF